MAPIEYLRNVRLSNARERLSSIDRNALTVTEVAMSCGYTHLSRFSRDYRARFGETPSRTLLKRRSLAD